MADIVERLRDYRGGDVSAWNAMEEAADEIERLREALKEIQNTASPDIIWSWYRDVARAALGVENG